MLRSMKYGLYGAVLAGLVAAPTIWNSVDKSVSLDVDGHSVQVSTTAADVSGLLSDNGYHPDRHDIVAPAASTSLRDGMHVVLRRGRLLHLDIDGTRRDVWTTAPTVAQALSQLGYTHADFVSVSRSRRLPLGATDIAIRTPQLVTVVHDGTYVRVQTSDRTVSALLADLGITVGPADRVSVPLSTPITVGQVIRIERVGSRTLVKTVDLAYSTTRHSDSSLAYGSTKVVTTGRAGTAKVYYTAVYVDGQMISRRKLRTVVVTSPRTRVIAVGTAHEAVADSQQSPTGPPSTPAQAQAIARQLLADRGWSDQWSCLDNIYSRESGWRVSAQNPSGAYGIPQALPGSKMAAAGPNWQTSAETQIKWGLGYIAERYHDPCGAWDWWQAHNWY